MTKKFKKTIFKMIYIGDNPPSIQDVERAAILGNLDEEGMITIRKSRK